MTRKFFVLKGPEGYLWQSSDGTYLHSGYATSPEGGKQFESRKAAEYFHSRYRSREVLEVVEVHLIARVVRAFPPTKWTRIYHREWDSGCDGDDPFAYRKKDPGEEYGYGED